MKSKQAEIPTLREKKSVLRLGFKRQNALAGAKEIMNQGILLLEPVNGIRVLIWIWTRQKQDRAGRDPKIPNSKV